VSERPDLSSKTSNLFLTSLSIRTLTGLVTLLTPLILAPPFFGTGPRLDRIGFIFQAFNLLDVLTVLENVALPLVVAGENEAEANRRADAALELVRLGPRRKHFPRRRVHVHQANVRLVDWGSRL
jgi:ABC-type taurine transport system ATPase subunit